MLVKSFWIVDSGRDTLGGKLAQWHIHTKGCQEPDGDCGAGEVIFAALRVPMMHVWIEPHPCGPFAALEGDAGGTIAEGETRLCDHAHGAG